MAEPRRLRLLKNTGLTLGTWLLPILPSLIATPVLIRRLGNADYGLYIGIVGIISYFFTAGLGKISTKYVAENVGLEDNGRIAEVMSATLILSQGIGLLSVALITIGARFLVTNVLHTPLPQQEAAVLSMYLACAIVITTTLGQIFQFAMMGVHRFGQVFLVANVSSALFNFGSIAVVILGFGVTGLFLWMLIVNSLTAIVLYVFSRRIIPEFRFTLRIDSSVWRQVSKYAFSIVGHQIFGNTLFLFERGWILRKFGAEVLAYYAVAMTLAMYIQLFASNLVLASFPSVNELLRQPQKLRNLYQKSTKYVLVFVVFAAVSLLVQGKAFLALWVSAEFAESAAILLVIHVMTFAILAMNTVVWQVNESRDAAFANTLATFLWMAVSIPLMIYFSDSMSAAGVAAARLVGVAAFIPFLFWSEARFLGSQLGPLWLAVSWRVAAAGLVSAAVEWGILTMAGTNWPALVISSLIGFLALIGILILCRTFDSEEREFFRSLILRRSAVSAETFS